MYRKAGNEMQYDEVKELIAIFEKTDLNDMEVQLDNARIRLNRGAVSPWMIPPAMPQPVVPQPQVAVPVSQNVKTEDAAAMAGVQIENEPEAEENAKVIKAPIVGTFYQSSAPDEEPFVKVGDTISEGDVVCIIEAMKLIC